MRNWKKAIGCGILACLLAFGCACGETDGGDTDSSTGDSSTPAPQEPVGIDVFADPDFDLGFDIYGTGINGATREVQKTVAFEENKLPVWSFAQWYSEYFLDKGDMILNDSLFALEDEAKSVKVNRNTGAVSLALNGAKEYGGVQGAPDAFWPHLLLQQTNAPVKFADCETMRATLTFRMDRATDCSSQFGEVPINMQAQFAWFIYVKNVNPDSAGFGEFLWFGFNLYDPTKLYAPTVSQQDFAGGTLGNYIYAVGAANWGGGKRVKIGEKVSFDVDMFEEVEKALDVAHQAGFMSNTTLQDCAITGMNIGFEVFDVWDMAATIYDMRVYYTED
ncbi:MAG: hypothetical protein IJF44_06020 [Clostridia bacterium]|nr:hypothetical protein [Clostridia bacterium]